MSGSDHDDDDLLTGGTAHPAGAGGAEHGDGHDDGHDGHGPSRGAGHPGRRRRLTVAVAVAAVLAAGGGAYWASSAGGGSGSGSGTRDSARDVSATGPADGSGSSGALAGGGRYRLTGTLPGDAPAKAPVYRAEGGPDRAVVQRLAAALGLSGPLVDDQGSWLAGTPGSGPALLVSRSAPAKWAYSANGQIVPRAMSVPPALPKVPPPAKDSGARTSGSGTGGEGMARSGAADPAPADSAATDSAATAAPPAGSGSAPVSPQRAEAAAAPVLAALGMPDTPVDASATAGAIRTVTADPVVGGLPVQGWETSVDVGPDGRVTSAYGMLSPLVKGEDLAVISARKAFARLAAAPRMMHPGAMCAAPVPDSGGDSAANPGSAPDATEGPGSAPGSGAAPDSGSAPDATAGSGSEPDAAEGSGSAPYSGSTAAPAAPGKDGTVTTSAPCGPHALPTPPPVDITGARFGLALQWVSGGQALVPAWLFDAHVEGLPGYVVVQPAVDLAGTGGGAGAAPPSAAEPPSPAQPPSAGPHRTAVAGYRAQGTALTLTFWGGVCQTYHGTASETATSVRVTVTWAPKNAAAVCPAIEKSQSVTVHLKAPLGARTVVDTTSGRRLGVS